MSHSLKRALLLGAIVLLGGPATFVGCMAVRYLSLPEEVPDDFTIRLSSGPCHAARRPETVIRIATSSATQSYEVSKTEVHHSIDGKGMVSRRSRVVGRTPISPEDVLVMCREVAWRRFFSLRDHYVNRDIVDGGTTVIEVSVAGKTKSVALTNTGHPRVDPIIRMVWEHGSRVKSSRSGQSR